MHRGFRSQSTPGAPMDYTSNVVGHFVTQISPPLVVTSLRNIKPLLVVSTNCFLVPGLVLVVWWYRVMGHTF